MVLCALQMSLVVLSHPLISARVQSGLDGIAHRLGGDPATQTAPAPRMQATQHILSPTKPDARPAVSAMPRNRVPVRRAGIATE